MNQHPDFLINEVNEPQDIKSMNLDQLKELAQEMQLVLERVTVQSAGMSVLTWA